MGGVALFDPDRLPDLTNGPPVHIEELRGNGERLYLGRPDHGAVAPVRRSSGLLSLAPEQRGYVEIQYTAIAFRAPEQVRFRHRLIGLSTAWVEAGTLYQASYANLPPGDYTFEVSAVNAHGYVSATPARLPFRIEARWHELWPVQMGAGLLLLVAGGGRAWWRIRELRRIADLERQAALAGERARLAKDLHDGLGAKLTEITLLSGVGDPQTLPVKALAERFRRLNHSTREALHTLRHLIWLTSPRADSLELLLSRLCESTERTLAAAGLHCQVDFPADVPSVMLGPECRRDMLLAVNEAVNNVVRLAAARQVVLRLTVTDGMLTISLTDDGRGVDAAKVAARQIAGDRGLGLLSLHERLSAHGGTCEIRSRPGLGTEVFLCVPLPK